MLEFTLAIWILVACYAAIVGVAKTGVPGIGLLGNVLLISFAAGWMAERNVVGFMLPLLIAGDVFALAYYRRHAVWPHLIRLLPWAVVGVVIGHQTLGYVDDEQLRRIIGVVVIVLLAADQWRQLRHGNTGLPARWWIAAPIGIAAGFATMLANAAGPLVMIYLLAMRLRKEQFMGTNAWCFFILNTLKIPFFLDREMITGASFRAGLVLLPAIAAGAVLGAFLLRRIPQRAFVLVIRVLTLCAALKLLLS